MITKCLQKATLAHWSWWVSVFTRLLGVLNSPRTEIGSSLSNHSSEGYGRLETQNDSYLLFQPPPSFGVFSPLGSCRICWCTTSRLTRVSRGRVDFWWISIDCLHLMTWAPSFLIVNINRISLKVENLLAANVLRYSEGGNKVLYGSLCLSVLNLVRQWKILSVDMEICHQEPVIHFWWDIFFCLHVCLGNMQMQRKWTHLLNVKAFHKAGQNKSTH